MSAEGSLLDPAHVLLDIEAPSREEAVEAAVALLRGDKRITSWDDFRASIGAKQVVDLEGCGGVVLAHGRSPAVKEMTLSAVRWRSPSGPRVVFVFAIPAAMAEEYLRKVGALARLCREEGKLPLLASAATPAQFASVVEEWLG
jgi:mannitol/fructose-specific phosphotransferase system IIA component (Ntr-type)